jgi:hypothetical protein
MGPGHIVGGVAGGLAFGLAAGWPSGVVLVAGAVAPLTAAGRLSPDMDQRFGFARGPLRHRGITHWPGLPAAAAAGIHVTLAAPWAVLAWAAWAGWVSHLVLDLIFGKPHVVGEGPGRRVLRGPGIPWAPWWGHWGFGGDVGGVLERRVITPGVLPLAVLALSWLALAGGASR